MAGGVFSRVRGGRRPRAGRHPAGWAVACLLVLAGCGGAAENAPSAASGGTAAASAVDPDARHDIGVPFDGRPYLGSVEVRADVPGEGAGAIRDSGRGSIHFERRDPGIALVLGGNIKTDGDASFFLDGRQAGGGWRSRSEDVRVDIGEDGTVAGRGQAGDQHLRFDGRVTPTGFDLDVEVTLAQASAKGLPAGTRFVFAYRLRRDATDGATPPAGRADDDQAPCRRFVWRVRNIADFSGGPMQMIQVPECVG